MHHRFAFPLLVALACGGIAAHAQAAPPASTPPAPTPTPGPIAADPAGLDFEQARFAANQDEARLDGRQVAALAEAQAAFMKPWVARCTRGVPRRELTPIGLVMQLDARGQVVRTWQDAHTPVADCLAAGLKAQVFYVPPKAPFLTAMDMSWSP
jgi:hypothetical protein